MRVSLRTSLSTLVVLCVGATVLWADDAPYLGTWKLNPARSDFGETTVTYEKMADGQMKLTADGHSYTFRTDEKEYQTPWGNTTAWKAIDARTWEVTNRANDKVVGTATLKLAADARTLNMDARNITAAGETVHNQAVYERVSGGSGLAGQWKTKNVDIGSPGTMKIEPSGSNGLTLTFVEDKGTCKASFDGKDYTADGPIWPAGWTCSIARSGATGLEVSWKRDGQVMYKDTFTPSPDGKILVDVGTAPKTNEKVKILYDRQ